jgi:hypothetical protein
LPDHRDGQAGLTLHPSKIWIESMESKHGGKTKKKLKAAGN